MLSLWKGKHICLANGQMEQESSTNTYGIESINELNTAELGWLILEWHKTGVVIEALVEKEAINEAFNRYYKPRDRSPPFPITWWRSLIRQED